MNIHPIFVHFPIGLLAVYSVIELIAYLWPKLRQQTWLFPVKSFLLFVGVLMAFITLSTGETAEELIADVSPRAYIIETHSSFATGATVLYLIIAVAYLVRIFEIQGWGERIARWNAFFTWSWNLKKRVWHFVMDTWLLPVLALAALICLTVAGALGAAIVYGPDIDPAVSFIYHLFFLQ